MEIANEFFTVSRVCELTGLEPERLDAVEATFSDYLNLRRSPAGNRLFTARDVDHLQEIRRLVDDEGLSLDQVKDSLFPPEPEPSSPTDTQPIWQQGGATAESGVDGPDMPLDTLAEHQVPPLPVEPTVDLLLEAAEGLVQENLRLREAVDNLGERFTELEKRVGGGFLRRLFGGR
ncbi:MAG: MerR family transcriptional regulator [Acidobacteria bacterium]|nr:MerR family transcriptional regulator [Acidobacteriota bacterium]